MKMLKACISILRIQFITGMQYRVAALARISIHTFYGFVEAIIIMVFYKYGSGNNSGMDMFQAISYVWLVQIIAHLLPGFGADSDVWNKIKSGDIGVELCKPLDLYSHWYARSIATRLTPFLLQFIPVTVFAMIIPEPYRLHPPASIAGLLACILSLSFGLLLSCACIGITNAIMLDVSLGEGPAMMFPVLVQILAGASLPLQLWPDWMQRILLYQPFAGLMDIPLRLYIGTLEPMRVFFYMPIQLAWTLLIVVIGRIWMAKNLNRVVVQGG